MNDLNGWCQVDAVHIDAGVNGPMTLDRHHFVGCAVGGRVRRVEDRFTIRQITVTRSKANHLSVGPVRIQECSIESISGNTEITGWATLFDRCILKGKSGRMQLYDFNSVYAPLDGGINALFREENTTSYNDIDWALDITDARFADLDIRSVPGELIRVNGESQVILNYSRCETAVADGKMDMSIYGDRILALALESRRYTRYNFVLVTHARQKYHNEIMDFFQKARSLGLLNDKELA